MRVTSLDSDTEHSVNWDLRNEGGQLCVFCIDCDKTFWSWPVDYATWMYPDFKQAKREHFYTEEHQYLWNLKRLGG